MDAGADVGIGACPDRIARPAGAPGRVRLIVASGKAAGRAIEVAGPIFRIGRDATCDLRPNNPTVSREHAVIEWRGRTVYVRDLGTTNGTIDNGRALRGEE